MSHAASPSLTRQLGSLFEGGCAAGLSDRQLLERFAAAHDQAAFTALVARHGPMVLGICRQLLGNGHDAEDALQAVFLVLAARAGSLREPELLGNWLYGVALRTARRAQARLDRRRQVDEQAAARRPEARPDVQAERAIEQEQAEALHREIDRLPASFRRAIVLCYFEGLSPDEAARRLRWPSGTLRSRLVRARDKLRRGLSRRGFALSLAPRASVSPLLCDSTTRAAIILAARHAAGGALPAPAAALAQEVLRTMIAHKLKAASLAIVLIAPLAAAVSPSINAFARLREGGPFVQAARTDPRPPVAPRPPEQRMTVLGRVLRPDGQPAAGVPVDIIATPRVPMADSAGPNDAFIVLGRGDADGNGRFRIEAARASSARFSAVYALACATGPGAAFGCTRLHPDAGQPTAEIHLPPEQVIRGKLTDISGQPAAGVAVQLDSAFEPDDPPRNRFDSPATGNPADLSLSFEGIRAWPKAATTDARGRFALPGVGRGLNVWLSVRDPRFAPQRVVLLGPDRDAGKEVALALPPSTIIEGRVLAADTGAPIPDAAISVLASTGAFGGMHTTRSRADGRGRFRINPSAGDYFRIQALAPAGQPYLAAEAEFAWTKAAIRKEIDLTAPRGVRLHGRVTEQGTSRPVSGAAVRMIARRRRGDWIHADATAREDGSFEIVAPPGEGRLLVLGPTLDYIPREIANGTLYPGDRRGGGPRYYAHDVVAYKTNAGEASREIYPTLRRGKTLRGRVVGPEEQTVEDALILVRNQIDAANFRWFGTDPVHARDGRFELAGLDPETPAPAYFLDAAHEWGAAVELSGKQAGEDLTIRLQPNGRAKARFVGPDGKPVAKLNISAYFHLLMTRGAPQQMPREGGPLLADEAFLANIDFKHYPNGPSTDADGRVVLPDLIPGAPYRVGDWSTVNVLDKGVQLRKDFTVKSGETVDLGDILVEEPGN